MTSRTTLSLTILLPLVACGGEPAAKQADSSAPAATAEASFDPCALLASEEIKLTLGWSPDSTQKKSYGTTGNCTYFGPDALKQVSLLVGQGMPDMTDSRKMADWRSKQYVNYKVTDAIVEPVEGLGVPAIRNEYGVVAIEMAVRDQLVSVGSISASFEQVRKLAGFVVARMK